MAELGEGPDKSKLFAARPPITGPEGAAGAEVVTDPTAPGYGWLLLLFVYLCLSIIQDVVRQQRVECEVHTQEDVVVVLIQV
jgi:hypothetical protein